MDRKHSPDTEQESFNDSFSMVMDGLIEGCQIIDRGWRYVYVNDTLVEHGRQPREALLGRTMMEVYPGIEETPMFGVLRECMESRAVRHLENEFIYPDGSKGWFELRFNPVPEGVFILSLDVTERKKAENALLHLNAVLRGVRDVNHLITREKNRDRLIQSACDCLVDARGFHAVLIALTEDDGEVIAHASAGAQLPLLAAGLDRGEMPPCGRRALDHPDTVIRRSTDRCEEECFCSGSLAGEDDVLTLALDHEGRGYGFIVAFVPAGVGADAEEHGLLMEAAGDIAFALHGIRVREEGLRVTDELRDIEQQLRQSQKLEAIGQLAGGVAHDFNNLLMVQMGYCDMMLENLSPDDPLASDLRQILACAERAAGLTGQLLAFSRKQALQLETLDLNTVLRRVEALLLRLIGEDIELATLPRENLGMIKADPGQIEQVIMNLALNARDAMPNGGRLSIETSNVDLDEGFLRTHMNIQPGPYVMLAVSDSGCGMDKQTQERLFEPFFTTKEKGKGTGLGLATVYGIVKQSGGNIWVYSEPGQGTIFKVYLPRVADSAEKKDAVPAENVMGSGERILVVEDDPALRRLFERMVSGLGYDVKVAASGDEALHFVNVQKFRPDLLITDVVMPRMPGSALAEKLSALIPQLKVLFTSGYTDRAVVQHGVLREGTPFLQKPFTRNMLGAKMREVLEEQSRAAPGHGRPAN